MMTLIAEAPTGETAWEVYLGWDVERAIWDVDVPDNENEEGHCASRDRRV